MLDLEKPKKFSFECYKDFAFCVHSVVFNHSKLGPTLLSSGF